MVVHRTLDKDERRFFTRAETLETLAERLEQAEKTIAELMLQLSWILYELVPNPLMDCKTGAEAIAHCRICVPKGMIDELPLTSLLRQLGI